MRGFEMASTVLEKVIRLISCLWINPQAPGLAVADARRAFRCLDA
jgi:hypothetical protein